LCIFFAALLMGGWVEGICYLMPMPEEFIKQFFWLGGIICCGAGGYLALLVVLRVLNGADVVTMLRKYGTRSGV
ncbi:MAG: hypothetical protein J6V89_01825, partial [Acetobacter sp.]|nr:hypothetical protein [Acetobacter sp.]